MFASKKKRYNQARLTAEASYTCDISTRLEYFSKAKNLERDELAAVMHDVAWKLRQLADELRDTAKSL